MTSIIMDSGPLVACVVRLAELHPEVKVCTTDTDFRFYRKNDHEVIPLVVPFALLMVDAVRTIHDSATTRE